MTLLDIQPSPRNAVSPRLDPTLWPRTTQVDETGRLTIGGVALTDIADQIGSPTYVLDEADFRHRARSYRKDLRDTKVVYAGKALLTTAVARWAAEEKLGINVCSGAELATALAGGLDATRIVYHGNSQSSDELRDAVEAGVGRIVVDSMMDITYVAGFARRPQNVLVRVTPDIDSGFSLAGGHAAEVIAQILAEPMLRLAGLHCHIGSQITDAEHYAEAVRRMIIMMSDTRRAHRQVLGELNIGGGHGVPYVSGDPALDVKELALYVDDAVESACAAERFPRPTIVVEPGRALSARAGVTLYRVHSVKTRPDGRTFVTVDGGLSESPRVPRDGAKYTATLAGRRPLGPSQKMTVVGPHRESGDEIIRDAELPADIHPGDLLAVACTGAYHHSMAATYNLVGRPPLVSVHDGQVRTLVRRETVADLMARDCG
jgi:diaminopimelate decarboxylase